MWVCFLTGNSAIPFCLPDGPGSNWGFERPIGEDDSSQLLTELIKWQTFCGARATVLTQTIKIQQTPVSKVTLRLLMKLFFRSSNWKSDEFQVSCWTTSYKTTLLSLLASTISDTDLISPLSSQLAQLLQFRVCLIPLPSFPEERSLAPGK